MIIQSQFEIRQMELFGSDEKSRKKILEGYCILGLKFLP